jgi:hypothetical protein
MPPSQMWNELCWAELKEKPVENIVVECETKLAPYISISVCGSQYQ